METCPFMAGCKVFEEYFNLITGKKKDLMLKDAQKYVHALDYLKKHCNGVGYGRCSEFVRKGGLEVLLNDL